MPAQRLKTDYLDLYQVHWQRPDELFGKLTNLERGVFRPSPCWNLRRFTECRSGQDPLHRRFQREAFGVMRHLHPADYTTCLGP